MQNWKKAILRPETNIFSCDVVATGTCAALPATIDEYGVRAKRFAVPTETDQLVRRLLMEGMLDKQFDLFAVPPSATSHLLKPADRTAWMGIRRTKVNHAETPKVEQERHGLNVVFFQFDRPG